MKNKRILKKKAKEALNWVKENPALTTAAAVAATLGGAAIVTAVKTAKNKVTGEDIIAEEIDIPTIYDWNEEYEDRYNKVSEFAKTLNLDKYEEFIIERCPNCDDGIIVSHLVDGIGVYKPED